MSLTVNVFEPTGSNTDWESKYAISTQWRELRAAGVRVGKEGDMMSMSALPNCGIPANSSSLSLKQCMSLSTNCCRVNLNLQTLFFFFFL